MNKSLLLISGLFLFFSSGCYQSHNTLDKRLHQYCDSLTQLFTKWPVLCDTNFYNKGASVRYGINKSFSEVDKKHFCYDIKIFIPTIYRFPYPFKHYSCLRSITQQVRKGVHDLIQVADSCKYVYVEFGLPDDTNRYGIGEDDNTYFDNADHGTLATYFKGTPKLLH
jgi:hypothetical protein